MIDELEVVRRLGADDAAPDRAARERVRARVLADDGRPGVPAPARRRRRLPSLGLLVPVAAVALAAALVLVLRPGGDGREFTGERTPSAAAVPSLFPGPSQFLYVRTEGRGFVCPSPGRCRTADRRTREVWIGERRAGRISERLGGPARATRLPPVPLGLGDLRFTHAELARYAPTGPQLLEALRRARPPRRVDGLRRDLFGRLADGLRERAIPPRVRRAIVEALPLVPGTEDLGPVTDSRGRRGIGFARVIDGQRERVVIDPRTLTMLEERFVLAAPRAVRGRRVGDPLGETTYLERAVVDRAGERP